MMFDMTILYMYLLTDVRNVKTKTNIVFISDDGNLATIFSTRVFTLRGTSMVTLERNENVLLINVQVCRKSLIQSNYL